MRSPRSVLLATDLSARSDRAMDRATLLLELLVSSIAKRIVRGLPCDALVVPG